MPAPNLYPGEQDTVIDRYRLQAGHTLERFNELDTPYLMRDINTGEVAEVALRSSLPAIEKNVRRFFHLEHFVGLSELKTEDKINGGN